ncbi:MAG: cation:proton antiporter [Hydrogenophaga sp.]|nr:cation:proton antiporter [Hydrogenophaga sp.]
MTVTPEGLIQILLLLGVSVAVVVGFQRLRLPSSLGYLLVGVLLGPYTWGPVVDASQIWTLAEFGIVFLLFTVGLNFSLPQLHALRRQVLGLGSGQVAFTTLLVGLLAWLWGLGPAAAFVVGAVFAQSSTTIITRQLMEQGEENSRHGRLGTAMSVFQDVTAVPFLVVIPVLGVAASTTEIGSTLVLALGKAVLAFVLVFGPGRWLLRPFFHAVAERRSAELFTLTVLFVSLLAAWGSSHLGLSMAFGAFLAGMVLGETEFRHQVESTIRPFRDVLLGLFFVGIGMLFNPASLASVWLPALVGAAVLMLAKTVLVFRLVRWSGIDTLTAWRCGLLLAVGGEFGFALLAIALQAQVIDERLGQVTLTAVLFSMFMAPFLIRHNRAIAAWLTAQMRQPVAPDLASAELQATGDWRDHVIVCGYGRIGQSVARLLEEETVHYLALDLDPTKVRQAHAASEPVFYGDSADPGVLAAVGMEQARMLVISFDDQAAALRVLAHVRRARPDLPVMARCRDESHVKALQEAGATEVIPESLEAGLVIASQALLMLDVSLQRVMRRIQSQRMHRYRLLGELYRGDALSGDGQAQGADRLLPVTVPQDGHTAGQAIGALALQRVAVAALVRQGERLLNPPLDTVLEPDDVLVLFGAPDDLQRAQDQVLG